MSLCCMVIDLLYRRCITSQSQQSALTLNGESNIHERRLAFFKKFKVFLGLQRLYMPGIVALIEEAEHKRDPDKATPHAEDVLLWLPSQVPKDEHPFVCDAVLFDMKFKLREGQCADALTSLRTRLFARQHLLKY